MDRFTRSAAMVLVMVLSALTPGCRRRARVTHPSRDAAAQAARRDAGWAAARAIFVREIVGHQRFVEDRRPMRHGWGEREVEAMLAALNDPAVPLEVATVSPYHVDRSIDAGVRVESGHVRLSTATLTDANARAALGRALIDAVERSNGMAAMCFNPRHAVSLTVAGQRISWIICLECLQIQLYVDGEFSATVTIAPGALANHLPPTEPEQEPVSPFEGS